MAANYSSINRNTPYGSGDPYYNTSTGFITPQQPPKKQVSNWIKFGIPVAVLIIVGAVLGGVLGSRASKNASNNNASSAATSAIQEKNAIGIFPTGTDSQYMLPLYPATVRILHVLPSCHHHLTTINRPIPRPSLRLHSSPLRTLTFHGQKIPSNLLTQARLKSALIVPVSSHLPTCGRFFLI